MNIYIKKKKENGNLPDIPTTIKMKTLILNLTDDEQKNKEPNLFIYLLKSRT